MLITVWLRTIRKLVSMLQSPAIQRTAITVFFHIELSLFLAWIFHINLCPEKEIAIFHFSLNSERYNNIRAL
jgi:hypothetical protein